MRILIILLIFLFINNCSNQNFGSFLKKKNDDMVEKPNLDIDKNISFEDFKNKIINYGKNSSFPDSSENLKIESDDPQFLLRF